MPKDKIKNQQDLPESPETGRNEVSITQALDGNKYKDGKFPVMSINFIKISGILIFSSQSGS